jgi:TonB family protein
VNDKPTKTPKLSEKHGKGRGRKAKSSLALSMVLHGLLGASLVGLSFYEGSAQKPRRVFEVTFGGAPQTIDVAESEVEVLEPETLPADDFLAGDLTDGTLLDTPGPLPDTTLVRERLEVTPVEDWTDQQLADDFQARDTGVSLLPIAVEAPVPPAEVPDEPIEDLPEVDPTDPEADERHPPQRIEGKDPDYPRLSSRLKEQGAVVLRLTLDEEGRVRGVELVESSGYSRLDEAAMSAAPKWRFDLTPNGVLRIFEHTVHFKLAR